MAKNRSSDRSKLPFLVKKAQAGKSSKSGEMLLLRWKQLYQAAIDEADPELMLKKIAQAEPAVFQRLLRLRRHPGKNKEEIRALTEAASLLCELKLMLFRKIH